MGKKINSKIVCVCHQYIASVKNFMNPIIIAKTIKIKSSMGFYSIFSHLLSVKNQMASSVFCLKLRMVFALSILLEFIYYMRC